MCKLVLGLLTQKCKLISGRDIFYTMVGFDCCQYGYNQPNNGGGTDAIVARFSIYKMWMVDIEDFALNKNIDALVYPNPASHAISVNINLAEKNSVSLSVYSIDGQKILELPYGKQQGVFSTQIDFSNYANGIYLLQIKVDNNVLSKKIIKHE